MSNMSPQNFSEPELRLKIADILLDCILKLTGNDENTSMEPYEWLVDAIIRSMNMEILGVNDKGEIEATIRLSDPIDMYL